MNSHLESEFLTCFSVEKFKICISSSQFCVSCLSQKLNSGAMCGSLAQLHGRFMHVYFSSPSSTVVPPAGGATHECTRVYFILLTWTLVINFTTGTRKLARGSVNIRGLDVYTELLFCREIYSTCILVKLHVQKKKPGAARALQDTHLCPYSAFNVQSTLLPTRCPHHGGLCRC